METNGPRVYVPITLPDSAEPSFAVLEFLGFSSPAAAAGSASSPAALSPSTASLPGFIPISINSASSLAPYHHPSSLISSCPPPFPQQFSITHHVGTDTVPRDPQGFHLVWPGAFPESLRSDTPPSPTGSSRRSVSTDSSSREGKDRKLVPIKASPMKKSGSCGSLATVAVSPSGKKALGNLGKGVVAATISVSQTERETIVHTHCSNFREVVRQLTGASSDDQDLLPVTLPSRHVNRNGEGGIAKVESGGARTGGDLGPRKPTSKLHERRKAMRNLEKLSTGYKDLPPLVPSPVTPLASDFERFCLPSTPTPTASQGSASVSPSDSGKATVGNRAISEDQAIAEDIAIAGKGFFLHSQRPRNSDPTLLSLFPESPVCSPRDL